MLAQGTRNPTVKTSRIFPTPEQGEKRKEEKKEQHETFFVRERKYESNSLYCTISRKRLQMVLLLLVLLVGGPGGGFGREDGIRCGPIIGRSRNVLQWPWNMDLL